MMMERGSTYDICAKISDSGSLASSEADMLAFTADEDTSVSVQENTSGLLYDRLYAYTLWT